MKRVHILVEGQTEETFVGEVLAPHLLGLGIFLRPIIASTKRVKSGIKFKGGVTSYPRVKRELLQLAGDTSASAITTMIDYYRLPADFPGASTLPSGDCYRRVEHLQQALQVDIGSSRLIPYYSLHEFEALILTAPDQIEATLPGRRVAAELAGAVSTVGSPEKVNDGPETHPAARIARLAPSYRKPLHGPMIAARIGLAAMRRQCPHFDRWVTRLEALDSAGS